MLAGFLFDGLEDKVALAEREGLDLFAVVVPQALLVDGRATERQEACFFEQVDAIFVASLASASVYIATRGESNSTSVGMTASAL